MNGAYDLEGCIWHQHSNRLLIKIMELWPKKERAIIDLGCGHNFYVSVLIHAGYHAIGCDIIDLGSKYFEMVNLAVPVKESPIRFLPYKGIGRCVLSLEVGEHIPAEFADTYLDNLVYVADGGDIILSWAVEGQAGHGHVNCQSNNWVVGQLWNRGYHEVTDKTADLREAVKDCHCTWFRNTLMYFKKNSV